VGERSYKGRENYSSCKLHPRVSTTMFTREESRANDMPAAAVIHWRWSVIGLHRA